MPRRPAGLLAGGQGVRSDPESEGFEEKYRAVIEWERSLMNRSAKDGVRSSPHYGGEGVTHSPIVPRCLLTARYGRFMRDPRSENMHAFYLWVLRDHRFLPPRMSTIGASPDSRLY